MANIFDRLPRCVSVKGWVYFVAANLFVLGIIYIGLAVPLVQGNIGPNETYGYRIQKTLADEDVWYRTNEYFGKQMIYGGFVVIILSALLLLLRDKVRSLRLILSCLVIGVVPLAIAIIRTQLFVQKL